MRTLSDRCFIDVDMRNVLKIGKAATRDPFDKKKKRKNPCGRRDCVKRVMNKTSVAVTENNISSA